MYKKLSSQEQLLEFIEHFRYIRKCHINKITPEQNFYVEEAKCWRYYDPEKLCRIIEKTGTYEFTFYCLEGMEEFYESYISSLERAVYFEVEGSLYKACISEFSGYFHFDVCKYVEGKGWQERKKNINFVKKGIKAVQEVA